MHKLSLAGIIGVSVMSLLGISTIANATDHQHYDYDTNVNVTVYAPASDGKTTLACAGSKIRGHIIFEDNDRRAPVNPPVPPGTLGAWYSYPGLGPYQIIFTVGSGAEFDRKGSGIMSKTVDDRDSGNIYIFTTTAWNGSPITCTTTIIDNNPDPIPPDDGSARDPAHVITWYISGLSGAMPSSMHKVSGPGPESYTPADTPVAFTYQVDPEINPPGRPNYQGQTITENFGIVTANGTFTMNDITLEWKKKHPDINDVDAVAAATWPSDGNGGITIAANSSGQIDSHDEFEDDDGGGLPGLPFTEAAINRGVGFRLPQSFEVCGQTLGRYTIDYLYQGRSLFIKKSGP